MKTISHHRVRVNIALRLFIFQQPAADVFARLFPRLSKQTELGASEADGDAKPKTTPEEINRFALALTSVDVGHVNMNGE